MPTTTALATRQFWLAVGGGLGLAVPLSLLPAVAFSWRLIRYAGRETWLPPVLQDWLRWFLVGAGAAILPALAIGWLLWHPMHWLLLRCQALGPGRGRWLGMLGTLLLFEAGQLLATGLSYAGMHALLTLGQCYRFGATLSLPWLLAALGATWHVLRPAGRADQLAAAN